MILDLYGAVDKAVVFQFDVLCLGPNTNGGLLVLASTVFQTVSYDADVACGSLDINANTALLAAVVTDEAVLNAVAMAAGKCVRLLAKEDAHLAIAFDGAVAYDIIGVTVPNADAVSSVF